MNNKKDLEFENYLEKIENPHYQGYVNQSLPEKHTIIDEMKFKLCKLMAVYKRENKLSYEDFAKKTHLTIPEVKEIVFSYIDKFTLDRLATYADLLFSQQLEIHIDLKKQIDQPTLNENEFQIG